jgi:hypothetical protein
VIDFLTWRRRQLRRRLLAVVANGCLGLAGCSGSHATPAAADLCARVTCVALDACHAAGVCDPKSGVCSNPQQPDGTACDDGNACTQTDTCQGGVCTGANPAADGTACCNGTLPSTCGGGVCAGVQQACAAGATTSVSGTVYAPNGVDPL